eukprot:scaffold154_cov129-Cylindrotheca_fusiformis.AAC.3
MKRRCEIPQIPAILWIAHISPFLNRASRNSLCMLNKELYEKRLLLEARWPYRRDCMVESYVSCLAFSRDGNSLAVGDANDGTIQILNCADGKRSSFSRQRQNLGISCLSFSADNRFLASARWDGRTIRLWDLHDPEAECLILEGHTDTVWIVLWSPTNSSLLASAGREGAIRLWRDDGSCIGVLKDDNLSCQVNALAFAADGFALGAVIETANAAGRVSLWDRRDLGGKDMLSSPTKNMFHNHAGRCTSIQFSPCGQVFATGSWDDSVKLWDATTYAGVNVLSLQDEVHSIAFSPNGKVLAAGCCDRSLYFWNMEFAGKSAKPLLVLFDHQSTSWCSIRFCRDGTLASSGGDKTDCVRLWNPVEHDWVKEEKGLKAGQDDYQQLINLWG